MQGMRNKIGHHDVCKVFVEKDFQSTRKQSFYSCFLRKLCPLNPKYTHRVPNVSPGLMFWGLIYKWVFGLVYRGPIFMISQETMCPSLNIINETGRTGHSLPLQRAQWAKGQIFNKIEVVSIISIYEKRKG